MKTTTRLYDIIYTTYNNIYGDFLRNHQIIYYDPKLQFSHKVVDYDDEVKTVCRNTIFYGLDFLDEKARLRFEQEFLARFLSRTIKFQTYENFNWKLTAYVRGVKDIISDYYINANKYLQGHSNTESSSLSESDGVSISRDNSLNVSLPQDNTDLSLDKDTYDYADTVDHSKSRSNDNSTQDSYQISDSTTYDVSRLSDLQAYHDDLFNDLDRLLFSQML